LLLPPGLNTPDGRLPDDELNTVRSSRTFGFSKKTRCIAYSAAAGPGSCLPTHPDSVATGLGSPRVPRLPARCSNVPRPGETAHSRRTAVAPGEHFETNRAAEGDGSTKAVLRASRTVPQRGFPLQPVSGSDRMLADQPL